MSTITFNVKIYGGGGGIILFGEEFPVEGKEVNSDETSDETFYINQSPGHQIVNVSGVAPSVGKITVEVKQVEEILSSADENVYEDGLFENKIINYTVK